MTHTAPAALRVTVRRNGKVDVRIDGAWITLGPDLRHLSGRYLTEAELVAVRALHSA